jgi:hypothetical protein
MIRFHEERADPTKKVPMKTMGTMNNAVVKCCKIESTCLSGVPLSKSLTANHTRQTQRCWIVVPRTLKTSSAVARHLYKTPPGPNAGNKTVGSLHGAHIALKSSNAAGMGAWGTNELMHRSAMHLGAVAARENPTKSANIH